MSEQFNTAVIGLGSMGYGIARSCLRAGHITVGIDISTGRAAKFRSDCGPHRHRESAAAAVAKVYARDAGLHLPGER